MDFDFPLIPLLPLPITLVPAATFAALENSQGPVQPGFVSSVSIGISSKQNNNNNNNNYVNSASSSFSSSSIASSDPSNNYSSSHGSASSHLSDQERLGAIVDALGEASAKAQELPTSITQRLRLAKNPTQRVYILRTGLDSGEDQWLDQLEIGSPLMQESIQKSIVDRNGSIASTASSPATISGGGFNKTNSPDLSSSASYPTSPQEESSKRSLRTRSEEKGVYVAGMLKMGEKKLFIVDKSGTLHEQEVVCVLDFYVDQSCQRRGFGKLLFDYMLKVEDIDPCQIAYDRPSPKLYQFLNKYFQLERHLPQPNQFAVFEGFNLLDTGETIKVDDDTFLANTGKSVLGLTHQQSQSSVQQQQQQQHFQQQQQKQKQQQQQADTTFIPSQFPATSRALQSSVVFSSGYSQDHSQQYTTTAGEISSQQQSSQQQQQQPSQQQQQAANRRVSSAFTSSISLSSPSPSTNGSPSHTNGVSGTGRISRLLASSIVFTDPTGGNA
ncbi:Alpha-tubulin N-acetyltransferase 1 [Mortierella sp. GBA35]|nr:Alpha-tubulin N-acetyltransferase 1 [Mortierella sp. GBA35]KAG0204867.1 Alpha-tubulin N-acetyltransferase 1 [Mortierella sp. NVP41]